MNTETYQNAPITEAALDIRVRLPKEIGVEALEPMRDEHYPLLFRRPFKVEFKVADPDPSAQATPAGEVSNTALGFAYMTEDRKQAFQVRTDGFTHNRLAPYIDWAHFSQEANRLWKRYSEFAHPEIVELLGLNYINNISVPLGSPFEDFLKTYIEVSPELPQSVNTYNLSFQLSWPKEEGVLASVAQSLSPPVREGFATLVLNIQAFKRIEPPTGEINEEEIWATFEVLRNVKNSVFEACITDLVRKEIR